MSTGRVALIVVEHTLLILLIQRFVRPNDHSCLTVCFFVSYNGQLNVLIGHQIFDIRINEVFFRVVFYP